MVGVVARLSLHLGRSRGTGPLGAITPLVWWGLAMGTGGWLAYRLAELLAGAPVVGYLAATLLFLLLFLWWIGGPVLLPGLFSRSFVSVEQLAPYGVPAQVQVGGQLLGSLLKPGSVFLLLVASFGAVYAAMQGVGVLALVIALLTAVLLPVAAVAASSTLQVVMADALHTRRGRDVTLPSIAALSIGLPILLNQVDVTDPALQSSLVDGPVATVLGWAPVTGIVAGIDDALAGRTVTAMLRLLPTVALVLGCVWLWARTIRNAPSRTSGVGAASARSERPVSLVPAPFDSYGSGPLAAAWGQQLRYVVSPAALRYTVVPLPIFAFIFLTSGRNLPVDPALFVLVAAAVGTVGAMSAAYMLFDFDGDGFEFLMLNSTRWRSVLAGKAIVAAPFALLFGVGLSVAVAVMASHTEVLPAAMLTVVCATLLCIGAGSIASVAAPTNKVVGDRMGGRRLAIQAVWQLGPVLLLAGVYLTKVTVAPELDDGVLAAAFLPLAAAAAWLGLDLAGRRLAADPWHVQRWLDV